MSPSPLDGAADLVVAPLPSDHPALSRRVVPAIYSSGSTARAWQTAAPDCEGADAVMLHDTPRRDLATTAHDVLSRGHALWYGVGIDGWARDLRSGARSRAQITARAVEIALRAREQGAELLMPNGEAAFRRASGTDDTDARVEGALAEALHAVSVRVPDLALGWTSYDHVLWHPIGWAEVVGLVSPVVVHSAQVYGALGGGALATYAGLLARAERGGAQRAKLVSHGSARAELMDGGAGWRPYLQLHGGQARATVAYALAQRGVCLWALATRADEAGREALGVLIGVARAGLWGDVRALQRAVGVADDGVYGPLTHTAVLRWAAGP